MRIYINSFSKYPPFSFRFSALISAFVFFRGGLGSPEDADSVEDVEDEQEQLLPQVHELEDDELESLELDRFRRLLVFRDACFVGCLFPSLTIQKK